MTSLVTSMRTINYKNDPNFAAKPFKSMALGLTVSHPTVMCDSDKSNNDEGTKVDMRKNIVKENAILYQRIFVRV